ncbi:MAG: hypothetical protein NTW19_11495 [Planctomycetota bacterium]|nr:hypothetical protein [Planctomycetota bacterium]
MIRTVRLSLPTMGLALLACLASGCVWEHDKPSRIINTPAVIADLASTAWERHVGSQGQFREWIAFRADGSGRMQRSDFAPVADFTYRVDAHTLSLQYYIEVDLPGNWRTRTIPYEYKFVDDTLILNHRGEVETWRRVRAAPAAR